MIHSVSIWQCCDRTSCRLIPTCQPWQLPSLLTSHSSQLYLPAGPDQTRLENCLAILTLSPLSQHSPASNDRCRGRNSSNLSTNVKCDKERGVCLLFLTTWGAVLCVKVTSLCCFRNIETYNALQGGFTWKEQQKRADCSLRPPRRWWKVCYDLYSPCSLFSVVLVELSVGR